MESLFAFPAEKRARTDTFVPDVSQPQALNPQFDVTQFMGTLPAASPMFPGFANPMGMPQFQPQPVGGTSPQLLQFPPAPTHLSPQLLPPVAPALSAPGMLGMQAAAPQPLPGQLLQQLPSASTASAMLAMQQPQSVGDLTSLLQYQTAPHLLQGLQPASTAAAIPGMLSHGSAPGVQAQPSSFGLGTQMQTSSVSMVAPPAVPQQDFQVGQQVEMKNDESATWSTGYITSVKPLMVAYSKEGMGISWKLVRSQAMAQQEAFKQQQEALQQQQYMQQLALQQQEADYKAAIQQQAMQQSMQWSMQQQQVALQQARLCVEPPQPLPPAPTEMSAADQGTDVVNHYGTLDVETSVDESNIKKAYRKLVLKWHPDKHPAERAQAEIKIRAINEAYEVLSNSTKRAAYDAQRDAIERLKEGARVAVDLNAQPRHDIPREFLLMPMGWPNKFVRYSGDIDYSALTQARCYAHSRTDAKMDGGLAYFEPFFQACKLSLWWLPAVKNMCRIRAIEARTRTTRGEAAVAGRAGGMNLGFFLDQASMIDSGLVLMDARKGEKDENVNFIVQPSPWYKGAWRFEAASTPGWFLCFQPPTHLRMVKQDSKAVSHAACVLDFTLVDFALMYKYIDIAEILTALLQNVAEPGWITLDQLKCQPNIAEYFSNVLQVPTWSDEDFQTYFDGHFDTWEFCATPSCMVRLRRGSSQLVNTNVVGFQPQ